MSAQEEKLQLYAKTYPRLPILQGRPEQEGHGDAEEPPVRRGRGSVEDGDQGEGEGSDHRVDKPESPDDDTDDHDDGQKEAVKELSIPDREQDEAEADEEFESSRDRHFVYIPEFDGVDGFDRWLNKYIPSKIDKVKDGIEELVVLGPEGVHDFVPPDSEGAKEAWEDLKRCGRRPTKMNVQEIAGDYNIIGGKWICYPSAGLMVDHYWRVIAEAMMRGEFGKSCTAVKVSTFERDRQHVVATYNLNSTDVDQVMDIEKKIRNLGFKCELRYKADVCTVLGIYGPTCRQLGLDHYLYISKYNLDTETSTITVRGRTYQS